MAIGKIRVCFILLLALGLNSGLVPGLPQNTASAEVEIGTAFSSTSFVDSTRQNLAQNGVRDGVQMLPDRGDYHFPVPEFARHVEPLAPTLVKTTQVKGNSGNKPAKKPGNQKEHQKASVKEAEKLKPWQIRQAAAKKAAAEKAAVKKTGPAAKPETQQKAQPNAKEAEKLKPWQIRQAAAKKAAAEKAAAKKTGLAAAPKTEQKAQSADGEKLKPWQIKQAAAKKAREDKARENNADAKKTGAKKASSRKTPEKAASKADTGDGEKLKPWQIKQAAAKKAAAEKAKAKKSKEVARDAGKPDDEKPEVGKLDVGQPQKTQAHFQKNTLEEGKPLPKTPWVKKTLKVKDGTKPVNFSWKPEALKAINEKPKNNKDFTVVWGASQEMSNFKVSAPAPVFPAVKLALRYSPKPGYYGIVGGSLRTDVLVGNDKALPQFSDFYYGFGYSHHSSKFSASYGNFGPNKISKRSFANPLDGIVSLRYKFGLDNDQMMDLKFDGKSSIKCQVGADVSPRWKDGDEYRWLQTTAVLGCNYTIWNKWYAFGQVKARLPGQGDGYRALTYGIGRNGIKIGKNGKFGFSYSNYGKSLSKIGQKGNGGGFLDGVFSINGTYQF